MPDPTSSSAKARCVALEADEIPRLQRFFEENPGYFLAVNGAPPDPDAARRGHEFKLPPNWPFSRKMTLGFPGSDGAMVAMADVISDLFVDGVWHIGLFIVASTLHGSGAARTLYAQLEHAMRDRGARWARLGVVQGNVRAERFWETMGYVEVRKRLGVEMGEKVNALRVMVKPLDGGALPDYLRQVARDRPESP